MYLGFILTNWLVFGNSLEVHSTETYMKMLIACLIDIVAFNSRNIAHQCDKSALMGLISYIAILYGFLADVFIFDYIVSGIDLAGACLILFVTFGVALYKLN